MGKLGCLIAFFLISHGSLFQQSNLYANDDSLFVKLGGDTVQVWNTDVTANCASRFSLNILPSGIDTFTVTEFDTIGPIANCICNYDLQASLAGLKAGKYTILVFRQELKKYFYPRDTNVFIGELSFTLQDSSAAEQTFHFSQSECKSYIGEQAFTARYWYADAVSAAETLHADAKIQNVYSDDVSLNGKAAVWNYKFYWYNQANNSPEYIYFHNNTSGIVFDSLSLYTLCCVMNITDGWFDSDSAIAYAEAHGGNRFRTDNPDYIMNASLGQALVPYSFPSWSITYLSKTDSSKKLSLYFDARENSSLKISFTPAADTLYLQGGCCQPGIWFHTAPVGAAEIISLQPDFNTYIRARNSSGSYQDVDSSYFLVTHSAGNYDYEVWYHPQNYPPLNPVFIPSDSIFYVQQDCNIQLIVKQNGTPVDSLSRFFIPQYGLGVNSGNILPGKYYLYQNHPNPFNPSTIINYDMPEECSVNIVIYNILGEKVTELVNSFQKAGRHGIVWNALNIPSGVYICRMRAGNFTSARKLVLIK